MEGFCRGCLIRYDDPMELLHYTEKYRRLFVYSTGLQVKRNDAITFQLCKDCFLNMKAACKFKKLCRSSDKKFKSYLTLKDVGDGIDFCTFLKNNDDTMTFRLPLISGSSTPANQKSREDDNESTCTSIRNFMTDILQGEEMPDTEARIIREVIEEEADVLDDSLDSHWLQDDASIDTDFRLDFSFSPFGTPKSVNHDHFYTPKRVSTNDQEQPRKYFSSISPAGHYNNVNDFTDLIKNNQTEKELCFFNADDGKTDDAVDIEAPISPQNYNNEFNNSEVPHKLIEKSLDSLDLPIITQNDKSIENFDLPITNNDKSLNNLSSLTQNDKSIESFDLPITNNDKSINNLSSLSIESDQLISSLDLPSIDSEKSINTLDLPSLPSIENDVSINNLDLPIIDNIKEVENMNECDIPNNNPNYLTTSKEIESLVVSKVNIKKLEKNKSCAIDKNLEKALEDKNNQEFSLDDLLGTPRAYPNASAASTPTITNILFGENLDLNEDKNEITTKLNSKDIGGLLDELLQDDSKNFYEAKENIATKDDFVKMDVDEVDTGTVDVKVKTDMLNTETEQFDTKKGSCKRNKKIKSIDALSVDFTTTDVDPLLSTSDTANKDVKVKKVITATAEQFDLENGVCNICSKKFQSIRALSVHFTKKHNIKIIKPKNAYNRRPKVCNICGKLLRDRQVLFKHLKRCRNKDEPQKFICDICGVEFSTKSKIAIHISSHYGKFTKKNRGKFLCTICGASSTTVSNFRIHQRRHTNDYSHKCTECNKGFYRPSDLAVHMRKHTGEKPFSCKYCDRYFARKDILTQHVKNHINDKPYKCVYCESKFTNGSLLKLHWKVAKKCKRKRDLLFETLSDNIDETSLSKDIEETEPVEDKAVLHEELNVHVLEELPYIDTEMSN